MAKKPAIYGSLTKSRIEEITGKQRLTASELRKLGLSAKSARYITKGAKVRKGVQTFSRRQVEKLALQVETHDETFSFERKREINVLPSAKGRTPGVRQRDQIERFILMHPDLVANLPKTKKGTINVRAVQALPEYRNLKKDLRNAIRAYERAGNQPGAHKTAGRRINEILFALTGEKRYYDVLVQRYNA